MSIPTIVFGRAVFAVVIGLGLLALLASKFRQLAWLYLVERRRSIFGLTIAATIAVWSVSAAGSEFPVRSFEAVLRTGMFVALAAMMFAALQTDQQMCRFSMQVLVMTSAISILFGILSMTMLPELFWFLHLKGWKSTPLQWELKNFSSLVVVLMPIFVWRVMAEKSFVRYVTLAAIAGMTFLVWTSYNRAAIAGLLAMLLIWAIAFLVRRGTRKHILLATSGIGLIFFVVVVWLKITRGDMIETAPGSDWLIPVWLIDFQRQTIWAHSLEIFERAPWFGIGANTINFTPGADAPLPGDQGLHIMPAHPHSWLFEILAETGTIGLMILLVAVGTMAAHLMRRFRQTGEARYLVSLTIMAGYWVSGFFNYSYWSAWWQASFVIGMALALASRSDTVENP